MFVIRLPNGNLRVPQSAIAHDGRILGDVYVEIGPQDDDYSRLAEQALTPEEFEQRRDRWRQDDEALRQEFLEFARRILGDVYVEIGPQDDDYSRLAEQALTPEEFEQRRDRWRQDDEALRQEFLEFARRQDEYSWPEADEG